jgi:mRNA interferase MazF
MIDCNRGDVVLISFTFSDESGAKLRPAVVVSSGSYHRGRQEAVIAAVTSQTDRLLIGDYLIADWQRAGLLFPSVATGILRTIKQEMIGRKLGMMSVIDMQAIDDKLRSVLGLFHPSSSRARKKF